jgi:hypothetical protein
VSGRPEAVQGRLVERHSAALINDLAVPFETKSLERAEDAVCAAGHDARGVEILDAHQPAAALVAGIEVASHRGEKRTQVQIPGRGRGEAADVLPAAQR